MELREAEFSVRGVKHRMREFNGFEDESLADQLRRANGGVLPEAELWAMRISKSLIEPSLSVAEVKKLPNSYYSTLRTKWIQLNDIIPEAFLGTETAATPDSSISASQS